MVNRDVREIKKAQKEAHLHKTLSKLFLKILLDDPSLQGFFISKVQLSDNKSSCIVFFFTQKGKEDFEERKNRLILYKPSIRKALSQLIPSRYTPQLIFKFDDQYEKQQKLNELLEKLKLEDQLK